MLNRHERRKQGSIDRKAVRGIAKAAGQTEPTAEEKNPAFLALQVRHLLDTVEKMSQVNKENAEAIQKAFAMVDVHHQVLQRVTRDLTGAVVRVRKLQVDGDVNLHASDFEDLKLFPEGGLNLASYYEEYRKVGEAAGEELADIALLVWSQGASPEGAVERARVEKEARERRFEKATDEAPDADYEEHFFGGTDGQSNHEQVPQTAEASG